jgi:WD40 repeat protein
VPIDYPVWGGWLAADGRKALAYNRYGAHLVDVASGRASITLPHVKTLAATLSHDGKLAATVHADKTLWVWRIATGEPVIKIFKKFGEITAVAISPRDRLVASANTKFIAQVWRVKNGHTLATLGGHTDALTDVDFSPDGRRVVTASRDGAVRVSDVQRSAVTVVLRGPADVVTSAEFSSNETVVSANGDEARLWDARSPKKLQVHGTLAKLILLADRRLAAAGRKLTPAERERYHG